MIKFSILSAFRRKVVAVLAIIGVGLGSGLLVAILALSAGAQSRFNRTFQQLSGTISVTSEGGSIIGRILGLTGDPLPISYVSEVRRIEGVEIVSPFVSGRLLSEKLGPFGALGLGLTGVLEGEELFGNPQENIIEGRSFSDGNEVIAGAELFQFAKLSGEGLSVGDKITVPLGAGRETIEISLVGVFETGTLTSDRSIFGPEVLARKMAEIGEEEISGMLVQVSDPQRVNEIAKVIKDLFSEKEPPVSASVAGDIFEGLSSFLDIFNIFLLGIALVSSAAGGISVLVVMLLTVFERRREFGILKASGWSNGNIISSVLLTSLTLSFLGVFLGLSVGTAAALGLQSLTNLELVSFTGPIFVWASAVGFITGLVGGILPALSAARVSPIETLRAE